MTGGAGRRAAGSGDPRRSGPRRRSDASAADSAARRGDREGPRGPRCGGARSGRAGAFSRLRRRQVTRGIPRRARKAPGSGGTRRPGGAPGGGPRRAAACISARQGPGARGQRPAQPPTPGAGRGEARRRRGWPPSRGRAPARPPAHGARAVHRRVRSAWHAGGNRASWDGRWRSRLGHDDEVGRRQRPPQGRSHPTWLPPCTTAVRAQAGSALARCPVTAPGRTSPRGRWAPDQAEGAGHMN